MKDMVVTTMNKRKYRKLYTNFFFKNIDRNIRNIEIFNI